MDAKSNSGKRREVTVSGEDSQSWYAVIQDDSLEQGDILRDFDVINIDSFVDSDDASISVDTMDAIVLTQSCDLAHGKARSIVLGPISPLTDFLSKAKENGDSHFLKSDHLESLRQGYVSGYHLINSFSSGEVQYPLSIVSFRELYAASAKQVHDCARRSPSRLRLLSPYKEHLAQALARFFMRVGLPSNIPKTEVMRCRP